jgi:hypothetical protein
MLACCCASDSTEAVTGVVGRAELLSALCLLWSLLCYSRGFWMRAVILTELAHGCKETGLLGFALFIWMELVRVANSLAPAHLTAPPKTHVRCSGMRAQVCDQASTEPARWWPCLSSRLLRCTLAVVLLLGNLLLRVHLLGGHTSPNFTYMDNPLWFAESTADQVCAITPHPIFCTQSGSVVPRDPLQ